MVGLEFDELKLQKAAGAPRHAQVSTSEPRPARTPQPAEQSGAQSVPQEAYMSPAPGTKPEHHTRRSKQ